MEDDDNIVRVRTLDGQRLLVGISRSKSIGELRQLLLDRGWPTATRHFHLVHKGTKLAANTQLGSLSLQDGEFIACIPYTRKQQLPQPDAVAAEAPSNVVGENLRSEIAAEFASLETAEADCSTRKKRRVNSDADTASLTPLERLENVFGVLNAVCGFLQKNWVDLTWKNMSNALADSVIHRDIAVNFADIENLATICPQVITLKRMPGEFSYIEFMHSKNEGGNISEKSLKQLIGKRKKAFDYAVNEVVTFIKKKDSKKEITLKALLTAAEELACRQKTEFLRPAPAQSSRPNVSKRRQTRCTNLKDLSVSELVKHLRQNLGSSGQIVHCEKLKARKAKFGKLDIALSEATLHALKEIGVNSLYVHQAKAVNAAVSMKSIIVSTSTASGKSLCYNIPVLEELLKNSGSCALYLFPTKALAQDQLRALRLLTALLPQEIKMGVYDGDTEQTERRLLRDEARLIISNPDMLHCSILPSHKQFERLLSSLRYVVIDEAHAYRGAFGCHTALVLRRLRRLCCHVYGSTPTFIICSATVANPQEHAMELTGLREVMSVQEDGSPCGEKLFLLWNPPLRSESDGQTMKRFSPILEVASLFAELVQHGLRCITFCKTRKLCELVLRYTQEILKETAPSLVENIRAYRAGYTPEDRRSIEKDLFAGKLRGVAATSALELGIDVGSLDATLHLGFPGTVASLWQQAGRAGRREKPSVSIYVAFEGPLDQHFMKQPNKLFSRPIENAQVDPQNQQILAQHLTCAAFEHPLHVLYDEIFFSSSLKEAIEELIKKGQISRHPSCSQVDSWNYIGHEKLPSRVFNIRAIDPDKYTIVNEATNKVIEEVEANKAFFEVYEGAVYINQGRKYLVKSLDLTERRAVCFPSDVKYYTKTRDFTDIHVVGSELVYPRILPGSVYPKTSAQANKCRVTTKWFGFRRIWEGSNDTFDSVDLTLPEVSYESQAAWIQVPLHIRTSVEAKNLNLRAGLHAACHALLNVMPLHIMCNLSDLGTECAHPQDKRCFPLRLLIFDRCPGGIGICARTKLFFGALLKTALEQIKSCECVLNTTGCPNCIQYFSCSEYNEVLDKASAVMILEGVLQAEELLQAS